MKRIVIFFTLAAVAFSYPEVKTWPLTELYDYLNKLPEGDPQRPYLEEGGALIFGLLMSGKSPVFGHAIIPSPSGSKSWTRAQLMEVADDNSASQVIRKVTAYTLRTMKNRNTAIVSVPAVDISVWKPSDINKYIKDPKTKPDLLPFLKRAQKEMNENKTQKKGKVTIVTPISLVPVKEGTNPYPMGYVFQKMELGKHKLE